MTIKELTEHELYDFECNMSEEYKIYTEHDEWGCAFVWLKDYGAEYNFCKDDGENYCAIYKAEINHDTDYLETDTDTYIHYEINFDNENWMKELENAMCEALIKFFNL